VALDSRAARERHVLQVEADQAPRGDLVVEPHAALAVRHHVLEFAAAPAQLLHDAALVILLHVDGEDLPGLVALAVDLLGQLLGRLDAVAPGPGPDLTLPLLAHRIG